jgi:hypothetical protein
VTASNNDEPPPSPYDGDPLHPREIRLLTIEVASEPCLQHVYPWLQPETTLCLTTHRHMFARLLINDGQRLELLASPPSAYRSEHIPSWCPDFSRKPADRIHFGCDWNRPLVPSDFAKLSAPEFSTMNDHGASDQRRADIILHLNKNVSVDQQDILLNAYGFFIDIVSEVVE